MRQIEGAAIYQAFVEYGVTHLCGAPIIMSLIANATPQEKRDFSHSIEMMTAAAPPPPAVIKAIEAEGISIACLWSY